MSTAAQRRDRANALDAEQRDARLAQQYAFPAPRRVDHPTVTLPAAKVRELADAFGEAVVESFDGHIGSVLLTRDGRGVHVISERSERL